MIEPSLALQKAIFAALTAPGAVTANGTVTPSALAFGSPNPFGKAVPVFDRVPDKSMLPYVEVGDDQVLPDRADCLEASVEITSTIHAYAYGGLGRAGVKPIAQAIKAALDGQQFDLGPDWSHVQTLHEGSRYIDEPDGRTVHAVLTFKTLLDAA